MVGDEWKDVVGDEWKGVVGDGWKVQLVIGGKCIQRCVKYTVRRDTPVVEEARVVELHPLPCFFGLLK